LRYERSEKVGWGDVRPEASIPSGAEAHVGIAGITYRLKPVPFNVLAFSASFEVVS
jgi:hypothetical protein